MAIIRPFHGLRPLPEYAARVACPPYDVLSADEARRIAENEPNSFLRVNKAELEFPEGTDAYSPEVYQRGRDNLCRLIDNGIMTRDKRECLYLYRLTMREQSQTGLVTLGSVREYLDGKVRKHEHTRPEKVNDRANHIIALKAQVGPVLSAFRHDGAISGMFDEVASSNPAVDFTSEDQVRHQLWVVSDTAMISALTGAFGRVESLYIADGHHRTEAAAEVQRREGSGPSMNGHGGYNEFFLTVLFSDRELSILPYNRVVRNISNISLEALLEQASASFDISPSDRPVEPKAAHQFGLYWQGSWHRLAARPGSFDAAHPTQSIDAAILANNLIDPILGITDPRVDDRIGFVGGIRGTEELIRLVDSHEYQAAFSLYPTSVEQLLRVADAGEVMPPKSTWFEPKLRTGMVVNMLSDE